jgi:hypothetical protein
MFDLATYPAPRTREAPPSFPQASTGTLPVVRYFSGQYTFVEQVRFTFSGPRLTGIGVFKNFSIYALSHGAGGQLNIELGYALEPVNENAVARTTPKKWTVLTELRTNNYAPPNAGATGLIDDTVPNTFIRYAEPLDLIVDQPFFYPVVSFWHNITGVMPATWGYRIAEQVPRKNLQLFHCAGQGPAAMQTRPTPACAISRSSPASVRSSRCSTRRRPTASLSPGIGSATCRRTTSRKAQPDSAARAVFTS